MPIAPIICSPHVVEVLQRYGWFPDRSIEIQAILAEWQLREIARYPIAAEVLRSLGGIDIDYTQSDDATLCPFARVDRVAFLPGGQREEGYQYRERNLGLKLFPIGDAGDADMFLDASGRVYASFGPICIIGDDIDDALNGLIAGRKWVRISDGR